MRRSKQYSQLHRHAGRSRKVAALARSEVRSAPPSSWHVHARKKHPFAVRYINSRVHYPTAARTHTATMATPAVELRAKFLQDAAHLLAASSPSAAAFLGAARDRLVDDAALDLAPKERDALRRECCGACGNLMVPGWSCRVSHRAQAANGGAASKDVAKRAARPDKLLVYTCLRCQRETLQTLQLKSPRHVARKRKVVSAQPALPVKTPVEDDDGKVAKSANASSKQRKKARKGGLQAMLEKSKAQNSSQGGLDLMDFAM
jgi:hypothetical protein